MKFNRVMVCFHRTKAVPVSGFWRNGKALIGPEVPCDTTDWAVNIKSSPDSGSYAISLEKVMSTVVVGAEFPELLADVAEGTVKAEHMFSQLFTNGSTATMEDHFNMKTSLLDTYTFVFQEGAGIDWSAGWKAKVPLLSEENTTVEVEVVFGAHQLCATSKPQIIDRSAKIILAPMTGCKAMAWYVKSVLAVNAVLTVQTTYTNGAVSTREVPAMHTSVSYDNAEIKLEGIAVVAKVTAGGSRLGRLRLAAVSLSSAAQSHLLEWPRYVRGFGAGRFRNMQRQHQLAANGWARG